MSTGRWGRARAGVAALLLALTASCAARASASAEGDYLALGDSITYGSHPNIPGDHRPFHPYPDDVAAHYGLHVVNPACPGETAASLIDMHAQSHGCENSVGRSTGFRPDHPLHVAYDGSQLAFAEQFLRSHPGTRLVTLGIGLNDLFVCRELHHGCTGLALPAFQQQLGTHLDTILNGVRHAGYHGRVVLLQYYALRYPDAQIVALNATIAAAAHRHGALLADGYVAFERIAGTSGSSCAARLQAPEPKGRACNLHPSDYGHRVLARAIEQALDAAHWRASAT